MPVSPYFQTIYLLLGTVLYCLLYGDYCAVIVCRGDSCINIGSMIHLLIIDILVMRMHDKCLNYFKPDTKIGVFIILGCVPDERIESVT